MKVEFLVLPLPSSNLGAPLYKISNFTFVAFEFFQRNWFFVTNSNFLILASLQSDDVNLWYFKLRLFDLTEFIVWNIYIGLQRYWDKQICDNNSIPLCKNHKNTILGRKDLSFCHKLWFSHLYISLQSKVVDYRLIYLSLKYQPVSKI